MKLELEGKHALVTGASKGIGYATAEALAREGCSVTLVARSERLLAEASERIAAQTGGTVRYVVADLSAREGIDRVVEGAEGVDILVNNAGSIPAGDLASVDETTWRHAWDLKVFGYILLTQALWPRLVADRGVVVNVIGSAGERAEPGYIAGCTGNAALMAFTRSMGKSGPREGVRVVGINPGPVSTDRLEIALRGRAKRDLGDDDRWRDYIAGLPFARPATPAEVADAVAFLASARSAYTSGTILTIDGGGG